MATLVKVKITAAIETSNGEPITKPIVFLADSHIGGGDLIIPSIRTEAFPNENGILIDKDANEYIELYTLDDTGTVYNCRLPSGETFDFVLEATPTTQSLNTLRETSVINNTPIDDVSSLIASIVETLLVGYELSADHTADLQNYILTSEKANANGVASLDGSATIPDSQIPSSIARDSELSSLATSADLNSHTGNTSNPHSVTQSQVGLANVDNTADANKPVSTAQQTALDLKADLIPTIKIISGTSYSLLEADLGTLLRFTNASAITLYIPADLSVGFNCAIVQNGDGQITPTEIATSIENPNGHTKTIKNGIVTIFSYASDTFIFQGATE